MKIITYEEWIKDPTPRMMWVWDSDEKNKVQRKVVYVVKGGPSNLPVRATVNDDADFEAYRRCAEIEKQRRMTNKELSWWLSEKPHREYKFKDDDYVLRILDYRESKQNEEVHKDVVIREDGEEWREPLIEEE